MAQDSQQYILRNFDVERDYIRYCRWWLDDDANPPSLESLPHIGFSVGDLRGCGFLALTDCDFSIMTFYYCNPLNTKKESYVTISMLIEACKRMARQVGKKYVFVYSGNRGMVKLLERHNFTNNDGHLVCEVA